MQPNSISRRWNSGFRFSKSSISAALAELVDAPDLGSGSERSESSSLLCRTIMKRLCLFLLPVLAFMVTSCENRVGSTPILQSSAFLLRTSAAGVQDTIALYDTICVGDTIQMGLLVSGYYNFLKTFEVKADTSCIQYSLAWNPANDMYLATGSDPEHGILIFLPEQLYAINTVLIYTPRKAGTHKMSFIISSDAGEGYSPREWEYNVDVK